MFVDAEGDHLTVVSVRVPGLRVHLQLVQGLLQIIMMSMMRGERILLREEKQHGFSFSTPRAGGDRLQKSAKSLLGA